MLTKLKSFSPSPILALCLAIFIVLLSYKPSQAQIPPIVKELAPVQLMPQAPLQPVFAQLPNLSPTDVTPFQVIRPRDAMGSQLRFRVFQKLPAPVWFNAVTEETGRWETNVFQQPNHGRQDFVFRTLPNITLGYAIGKNLNVYTNYFVIKDIYAVHGVLSFPTTQSLSMGIRRDFPIGQKTVLQLDTQARELWETVHLHQADLLPAINVTRIINSHIIFFGSLLLQMRSGELFCGPTREIDPFYNAGLAISYNNWNFVITDTYVTNFRNPHTAIPAESNVSMIADFEISHPLSKRTPNLYIFTRAEPIWNWRSHFVVGQSGYDFRWYSGLRLTLSKPAYNADIKELRQKLRQQAQELQQGAQQIKEQKNQTESDPSTQ